MGIFVQVPGVSVQVSGSAMHLFEVAPAFQGLTKEFVGFVPGASMLQIFLQRIRVAEKSATRMQVPGEPHRY